MGTTLYPSTGEVSSFPKIFPAGDFATGARTLIDAIAHAKECALVVDEALVGKRRITRSPSSLTPRPWAARVRWTWFLGIPVTVAWTLKAALAILDLHQERYLQLAHRLESWLARHWPELPTLIELTSSSLMALLARIGGPVDVAANPEQATKLLRGISHRLLPEDKIAAIIASANASVGVPLVGLERDALMAIAADAYRAHRAFATARTKVAQLADTTPAATLVPVVGPTTAAAVFADIGDARSFPCARAFLKAMGLAQAS